MHHYLYGFYIILQFNPVSSLSDTDPGYNSSPSLDDRVHLLVCVCSANVSEMKESVMQKMKEVREIAHDLGKCFREECDNVHVCTDCSPTENYIEIV